MKLALPVFLLLCGCGPIITTPGGVEVYDPEGLLDATAAGRAENRAIENLEALGFDGLRETLPEASLRIEFTQDQERQCAESNPNPICFGFQHKSEIVLNPRVIRGFDTCWSVYAHELTHYLLWKKTGDNDAWHERAKEIWTIGCT